MEECSPAPPIIEATRDLAIVPPMGTGVPSVGVARCGGGGPVKALWATKRVQPRGVRKPTPAKKSAHVKDVTKLSAACHNHHQITTRMPSDYHQITTRPPSDHRQTLFGSPAPSQRTSPTQVSSRTLSRNNSNNSIAATSNRSSTSPEVTFVRRMGTKAMLHTRSMSSGTLTTMSAFGAQIGGSEPNALQHKCIKADELPETPDSGTSSAGTFLSEDFSYTFSTTPRSHASDERCVHAPGVLVDL